MFCCLPVLCQFFTFCLIWNTQKQGNTSCALLRDNTYTQHAKPSAIAARNHVLNVVKNAFNINAMMWHSQFETSMWLFERQQIQKAVQNNSKTKIWLLSRHFVHNSTKKTIMFLQLSKKGVVFSRCFPKMFFMCIS